MIEKNQETQVDIIAEMRMGNPVGQCAYKIGLPDKEEVYESGARMRTIQIKDVTVKELADRLEEAAKREKAQRGNAAALRDAVIKALTLLNVCDWPPDVSLDGVGEVIREIDSVLDKPPRNCDVGTAEEQSEGFMDFCRPGNRPPNCEECKVYLKRMNKFWCQLEWAQMPYEAEEGGAE